MYIGVGAISKKRILVTNNALNLIGFSDKVVFIRKINNEPILNKSKGTIYKESDVDFECCVDLFSVNTFRVLFDLGLLSHHYNEHKYMLLPELLKSEKDVPEDLLEYVYNDEKENYDLRKLISLVQNVSAMKWILGKKVKCCTMPGWGSAMEHLIVRAELDFPNACDILKELNKCPELIDVEFLRDKRGNETNLEHIKKNSKTAVVLELCSIAEKL